MSTITKTKSKTTAIKSTNTKTTAANNKSNIGTKSTKLSKSTIQQPTNTQQISIDEVDKTLQQSDIINQLKQQYILLQEQINIETKITHDFENSIINLKSQLTYYNQQYNNIDNKYQYTQNELQRINDTCNNELSIYKEKLRYLMYEQSNDIIDSTIKQLEITHQHNKQYIDNRIEYNNNIHNLILASYQTQNDFNQLTHNIHTEHEQSVQQLRIEYDNKHESIKYLYEYNIKSIRDKYELIHKNNIETTEYKKLNDIEILVNNHKIELDNIQKYFTQITNNNLELIKNLKNDIKLTKKNESITYNTLNKVIKDTDNITKPLEQNNKLIIELNKQYELYENDKSLLKQVNNDITDIEHKLKNLEWLYEIAIQKYNILKNEYINIKTQFNNAAYNTKQKLDFELLLLNKKYKTLSIDLEKTNIALYELLVNIGINKHEINNNIQYSLDSVLNNKHIQLNIYEQELNNLKHIHTMMIDYYKKLCNDNNISLEILGLHNNNNIQIQAIG